MTVSSSSGSSPKSSTSKSSATSECLPEPLSKASSCNVTSSIDGIATAKTPKSAHRLRGQETPAKTRLTRPFRSPFSPRNSASSQSSSPEKTAGPLSVSKRSALQSTRSERQELETRLLTLQQTEKYLREGSLHTMPRLIRKWRQAGQSAAQDLWLLTGANSEDFAGSIASLTASKGDYGLESQPFSQADSQDRKRKYRESASPESYGPILERRPRNMSAGAEELANGLQGQSYDVNDYRGSDVSSQSSLPDAAELLRRSQKLFKSSGAGASAPLMESWANNISERSSILDSNAGNGTERSWNVGSMLDMLGADKSILGWDAEEEEFHSQKEAVS